MQTLNIPRTGVCTLWQCAAVLNVCYMPSGTVPLAPGLDRKLEVHCQMA